MFKKIDDETWEKIAEAHRAIDSAKKEIEQVLDQTNDSLSEISDRLNAAREQAYLLLDEVALDAENAYEEKSDKWKEGEAGQSYYDWASELGVARDLLSDSLAVGVDTPDWMNVIEDMLSALDGGFRKEPGD